MYEIRHYSMDDARWYFLTHGTVVGDFVAEWWWTDNVSHVTNLNEILLAKAKEWIANDDNQEAKHYQIFKLVTE